MPRSMRGTDLMYKVKYQTIENMLGVKPNIKWNFRVFKSLDYPILFGWFKSNCRIVLNEVYKATLKFPKTKRMAHL